MPDVDVAIVIHSDHATHVVEVTQMHDGMLVLTEQLCFQILTH